MSATWQRIELEYPIEVFRSADRKPRFSFVALHDESIQGTRLESSWEQWASTFEVQLICPQTGPSWWTNRCGRSNSLIPVETWFVNWLASDQIEVPKPVMIFGEGMGGQGALRWAFRHPRQFPIVVSWNADLEHYQRVGQGTSLDNWYDSPEQCRQDGAALHLHPSQHPPHLLFGMTEDWSVRSREHDRLVEKLNALGVTHRFERTNRAAFVQMAQQFLLEAAKIESRRIL